MVDILTPFTNEVTESLRGQVTCPNSQTYLTSTSGLLTLGHILLPRSATKIQSLNQVPLPESVSPSAK